MKNESRGPLPLRKTVDDAVAVSIKRKDNFYLTAFMIEVWLGQLVQEAAAEYAEKKQAKDRRMQTGRAAHRFSETFGRASDDEFPRVFGSLCRFAEHEGSLSKMILEAALPLSIEHACTGKFVGPNTPDEITSRAQAVALMRRTVRRWCEWLDAVIHDRTHTHWHLEPVCFDPDADKRELAALGSTNGTLPS